MSQAARMSWLARLAAYAEQNGGMDRPLKPGQLRRLRRKDRGRDAQPRQT